MGAKVIRIPHLPRREASSISLNLKNSTANLADWEDIGCCVGGVGRDEAGAGEAMRSESEDDCGPSVMCWART